MIPPAGMALAALTVMLWILWSDNIRARRPSPTLYSLRIVLFLTASGLLVFNLWRMPWMFSPGARMLVILTALVGVGGAVYFGRRLARRA